MIRPTDIAEAALYQPESPVVVEDRCGRPLKDLRISVIDTCNFRCPYCMPVEDFPDGHKFLPRRNRLKAEELERVAAIFAELGVEKIRITGGEPLLRKDLPDVVERLALTPGIADLALTTNGMLLGRHAKALQRAGLRRVTVSLDSLDAKQFRDLSGGKGDLAKVLEGIEVAERSGLGPIKINAVIRRGLNEDATLDLARYSRETGRIVRFIEYMDVGNRNGWQPEDVVSSAQMVEMISRHWPLESLQPNYQGEVARRYRFADGGSGELGFISSVSEPFCGDCTRARLSTDGMLYTCLFATSGYDLRHPLRDGINDDELALIIAAIWEGRGDRYSELRVPELCGYQTADKIEMYTIGG